MTFNVKSVLSAVAPFIMMLVGVIVFAYWYIPEKGAYSRLKEQQEGLMQRLETYENVPENTAIRSVVTQREKEQQKLQEEYQAIQNYLREKYQFAFIDKYAKLTGLDFKNLIEEKRKELKREQIGFEEYDTTIPKANDIPDLVKRLEVSESLIKTMQLMGIASYDHIQISPSVVVKNEMTQTDIYEEFMTTFQVSAEYGQFMDLLYALEHSRVFMVISYCKISGVSDREVRAEVALKAIRFLPQT